MVIKQANQAPYQIATSKIYAGNIIGMIEGILTIVHRTQRKWIEKHK